MASCSRGRFAAWLGAGADRPVAAVFVFDTSYRMEYRDKAQSRLDVARLHALGLQREMADGSKVAVLDTGDAETEEDWMSTPSQVRGRFTNLRLRPVVVPLRNLIDRGRRMLLEQEGKGENAPMPLLYVFSDRTRTSWEGDPLKDFHKDDDKTNPITVAYVDVGAQRPEDVAIASIKVDPATVAPGKLIQVKVSVRATGRSYHDFVTCGLDGDLNPLPQRVQLKLEPGQARVVTFDLRAPQRGPGAQANAPYQAYGQLTARLITSDNRPFVDALPFNNTACATFMIHDDTRREGRKVLTIVDPPAAKVEFPPTLAWEAAFKARLSKNPGKGFDCDVRPLAEVEKLTAKDLERYRVVCLFEVLKTPDTLWEKLKTYVQSGGGLVIVPGGEGWDPKNLNEAGQKHGLLPAEFIRVHPPFPTDRPPTGGKWQDFAAAQPHPLLLPFREWQRSADPDFARPRSRPFVNSYWEVKPAEKEGVIVSYNTGAPALVEKAVERGRVVLFTVPLDAMAKFGPEKRSWLDKYWVGSSFGMVLVNELASYLAGDSFAQECNFWVGQPVTVSLPHETQPRATFKLDSPDPDLADSERTVQAPKELGEPPTVVLPQAVYPGNYHLLDRRDERVAAFSLNVRPEESDLAQVDEKEIEDLLGAGSVLKAGDDLKLADTMQGNKPPPSSCCRC